MEDALLIERSDQWAAGRRGDDIYLNASAVAFEGQALVFLGASGSGKSTLALSLMGFGAQLVSDDGVWLCAQGDDLIVERPPNAPALIEARQLGLLPAGPIAPQAHLCAAIDLDRAEPDRLPPRRRLRHGDRTVALLWCAQQRHLAPALWQILRYGVPQ
ncbi:MAG: serine kinase [Pseudomonadota bacterium]